MVAIGIAMLLIGTSPYSVWHQVYDGGREDMGHGVCLDSADHVLVVGETNQASDYDCWMIALSKSGDSLWSLLYNDGRDEKGNSIATTHDGAIAIAATTDFGVYTILYDQNLNFLWKRPMGGEATSIIVTYSNQIYTLGWHGDIMDIRGYNYEGEQTYSMSVGGFYTQGNDLVVDPTGYVYVSSLPFVFWKFSPAGIYMWRRFYSTGNPRGFALAMNDAMHFFQVGEVASGTHFDFLLLKWNTSGRLFWDPGKNYDLGHNEYCRDIKLDEISDCYLAGYQVRGSERDAALVKTDSAGNMLWGWVDTLEGKQEIEGIEVDADGYIYLAGSHHNGENWDMLVMKVAQPLTITGRVTDSTDAPMEAIPVLLTGDTTVEVLTDTGGYYSIEVYNGGSYTVSPNLPNWSFEPPSHTYTPLAHREFDQDFTNGRWSGISEQPTPLSPTLDVSDSPVKITIYDTAGREVAVLAVWNCAAGNYYLSLPNLESGVYFVRLQTNSLTISKKVIDWH